MPRPELLRVQRAARKREASKVELPVAILAAVVAGDSYRTIARYANLSPSRVHDLAQEARELEERQRRPEN